MKQTSDKNNLFSRWLSGNIRAKEEAALNKEAAGDPFLQEALDGYRSQPHLDYDARLDKLRNRLAQPKKKQPLIIPIYLRRVAAAVILLIGIATVWWINNPNATTNLSMDKRETAPVEEVNEAFEDTNLAEEEVVELDKESLPKPPAPPPAVTQENAPQRAPEIKEEAPAAPIEKLAESRGQIEAEMADELATEEIAITSKTDELLPPPTTASGRSTQGSARAEKAKEEGGLSQNVPDNYSVLSPGIPTSPPVQNFLEGRIFDQEGKPVVGASVQQMNNAQVVLTDRNGSFRLTDTALFKGNQLAISHFNYEDTTIDFARFSGDMMINLNQGAIQNLATSVDIPGQTQPYPEGGFTSYFDLEEVTATNAKKSRSSRRNRQQRLEVKKKEITTIAFTISKDGSLKDFEVIKAPNRKKGQEAIDLLQNGPRWIIPSGLDSMRTQISLPLSSSRN